MYTFNSVDEIIKILGRANKLIAGMFEKRTLVVFRYSEALSLMDDDENRLCLLIEKEVIHQNGMYVELDERFLEFFELLLEANEDINTASIDDNLSQLRENMDYYLQENISQRQKNYLREVKSIFRRIAKITLRNAVLLQYSIDSTYKNEPNYRIKIAKLENLDKKRINIQRFIFEVEKIILKKDLIFFNRAMDDELSGILLHLREDLQTTSHHLIKCQQDVINFLNQIRVNIVLVEKIRKVKYLRDQMVLKAKSNLVDILKNDTSILIEGNTSSIFRLSLNYLASDSAKDVLLKVNRSVIYGRSKTSVQAKAFNESDLIEQVDRLDYINLDNIMLHFFASDDELFPFVLNYKFNQEVDMEKRITIFCQLVSIYEPQLDIKDEYGNYDKYEYARVFALNNYKN